MSSQRLTIFLANTRTAVLPLGACGSQHPYGADAQPEEDAPCFISLMPGLRAKQLSAAPHNAPNGSNENQAINAGYKGHRTVRRTSSKGSESEKFRLLNRLNPRALAKPPLLAACRFIPVITFQYKMVDRWDGRGQGRLKTVDLSVLKKDVERTALEKRPVYIVRIKPGDGSFEITQRVLAAAPHFPVKIEYARGGLHLVSEIVALAIGV